VFVRVFSSNELRLGFAIAAVARWKMQKDVNLHVLDCCDIQCPNFGYDFRHDGCAGNTLHNRLIPFATESLHYAEKHSKSDPYIIANDDTLIYGQDFVGNGLRIMKKYPEFGCVSGAVTNGDQFQLDGPEITEIHAVGGLVFLRKGLVTEFPPLEDAYWDIERHRQVVAKGFKSGYTRMCPYLHMGANFSVANPAFFTGA
jgi:hypothetical protein